MAMYRVTDERGMPLGVFDTVEEAKAIAPEVERWSPVKGGDLGDFDGWRPDYSIYDRPHIRIRTVSTED